MYRTCLRYSGSRKLIYIFALFNMIFFSGCSWLKKFEKIFWPNKANNTDNEKIIMKYPFNPIKEIKEEKDVEEPNQKSTADNNKGENSSYTTGDLYDHFLNSYHINQNDNTSSKEIYSEEHPKQKINVYLPESPGVPSSNPLVVASSGIAGSEKIPLNETGVEQNKTDQTLNKEIESDQKLQDSHSVEQTDKDNNNNVREREEEEKEEQEKEEEKEKEKKEAYNHHTQNDDRTSSN